MCRHRGGIYDSPQHMTVTYRYEDPDWTLVWAQPGEPSEELDARYGAVYWGDNGRLSRHLRRPQHNPTPSSRPRTTRSHTDGVEVLQEPRPRREL